MTTLGQQGSKVRLAAITLLTNLVEVHTAKEVFELSINGFYHEEFRIREGCCLFVLSVIKECVLIELLAIEHKDFLIAGLSTDRAISKLRTGWSGNLNFFIVDFTHR